MDDPLTTPQPNPQPGQEPEDMFGDLDPLAAPQTPASATAHPQTEAQAQGQTQDPPPAPQLPPADNPVSRPMKRLVGRGSRIRLIALAAASVLFLITLIAVYLVPWFTGNNNTIVNINQVESPNVINQIEPVNDEVVNKDSTKDKVNTAPSIILDSDGDGLTDQEEAAYGTLIGEADSDRDGLTDRQEIEIYKTDPLVADTDGDTFNDGEEVRQFFNPNGDGKLLDIKDEIANFENSNDDSQ